MNNTNLKSIYKEIKLAKNILILTHQNPDGDAIGSMMALKLIIERLNIPVDGIVTSKIEFMEKVPGADKLLMETKKNYDLTILVDINAKERLGHLDYLYDQSKKVMVLDHHKVEAIISSIHYVDSSAASATMVIYHLAKENDLSIDYDLAYYLYLGLLTDTGGFVYNNTDSNALGMAADLLKCGINHNELYFNFVTPEYDLNYLMLEKIVIDNLEIIDTQIATTFLSYENITNYPYDTPKNFVNIGRYLKDVEVSLIFVEEEPNSYRLSLRSKKYLDVSEIAKKFNGGGHKFASGIRFIGNFEETKNKIIKEIKNELK